MRRILKFLIFMIMMLMCFSMAGLVMATGPPVIRNGPMMVNSAVSIDNILTNFKMDIPAGLAILIDDQNNKPLLVRIFKHRVNDQVFINFMAPLPIFPIDYNGVTVIARQRSGTILKSIIDPENKIRTNNEPNRQNGINQMEAKAIIARQRSGTNRIQQGFVLSI